MVRRRPRSTLVPYTTLFRSLSGKSGWLYTAPASVREPSATLSPCDIPPPEGTRGRFSQGERDRKSTRLNSSHVKISYAVFCLKKKKTQRKTRKRSPVLRKLS